MTGVLDMRVLTLLVARLCHDLAGPIAAVGNGIEMAADPDPDFAREAIRLVAGSADEAAKRLQFYRFAYGSDGEGAVEAIPGAPSELALRFFAATTIACDYAASASRLPTVWQKLACNLLLVGAGGLPRGGALTVAADACGLVVDAVGEAAFLPPELAAALAAAVPAATLTPRTVQAYWCALLAAELGCRLRAATDTAGRVRIYAATAGS
jgi:histidine phosphotransferase ChpT